MTDDLTRPVALIGTDPGAPPPGMTTITVSGDDRDQSADSAAAQLAEAAHVVAIGADAPGALSLAARHVEHVVSLVLVDPDVRLDDPVHLTTMDAVTVPTLVIASAPTPDHPVEEAQSIAGGIDNGVFVIIDGSEAPTLVNRPASVIEWASAFMSIAEGLAEARNDLITTVDKS